MSERFTLDGSEALETHLAQVCYEVLAGVQSLIPTRKLEALLLGGGYGRGEGGVLKTETGEHPYNDLEFYVFLRGNELLNEHRFGPALRELGERLSPKAGLHVEFKLYSVEKLRRAAISMFTYDLMSGHRTVFGNEKIFCGCEHHLLAAEIPLSEATRLLFNRCSGLLLVKELLSSPALSAEQADFIGRNLAKAQLAFGDAVLTAFGQYHWSCPERHRRLNELALSESLLWLPEVLRHHAAGVAFKLHPHRTTVPGDDLQKQHRQITALGLELWLWLERRRLRYSFPSARDYALSDLPKCPETARWRNYLLNLKSFGLNAAFGRNAARYPRERLFNALALLLWDNEPEQREVKQRLQNLLRVDGSSWSEFLSRYKSVWPSYG